MANKSYNLTALSIAIGCALSTWVYAAQPAATTTSNNLPAGVNSSKAPQPAPLVSILAAPPHGRVRADSRNMGRFGEFRWRTNDAGKKYASFHEGIDIATGLNPLYAPWNGQVTKPNLYAGWSVGVRNTKGGTLEYLHTVRNTNFKTVNTGEQVAVEGAAHSKNVHLHMQYNAAPNERPFSTWLGERGKGGEFGSNVVYGPYMTGDNGKAIGIKQKPGRRISDPTPNLSFDVQYSSSAAQRYSQYLGTTARQQFNRLYRTNMPLNVPRYGSGSPMPENRMKDFPAVLSLGSWDALSAGAANMSAVNGAVGADISGYDLGGSYVSYQALSSFLASDDGAEFGTLPPLAQPVSLSEMTMAQIVDQIGNRRYGNTDWNKAMAKLSSKAMMTEYLMMTSEANFLDAQTNRLKNRVEMLFDGLAQARLHDYSKKVETLQVIAQADAIPKVINRALEAKGDEYVTAYNYQTPIADNAPLPTDMDGVKNALLNVIFKAESAHGEGGWNASNNGTIGKGKNQRTVCSRPNGGVWNLTSMTLGQMKRVYREANKNIPSSVNDCSRLFAAGRYQIIYSTFLGAQKSAGVPDSALFNPQTQTKLAESLLLRRVGKLLRNQGQSLDSAKIQLSQEWASLGLPGQPCDKHNRMIGWHGGANKASCSVTYEVWALLEQADKINKSKSQ